MTPTHTDIDTEMKSYLAALHDEVLELHDAVKRVAGEHGQECTDPECDYRTTMIVGIANMLRHDKDPAVLAVYVAELLTRQIFGAPLPGGQQ